MTTTDARRGAAAGEWLLLAVAIAWGLTFFSTKSLLERFAEEGEAMLANTRIWVCDICGFIYLGDALPEICPVCKVPNYKIIEVERR